MEAQHATFKPRNKTLSVGSVGTNSNESKLHRVDAQSYYMSTNQYQMLFKEYFVVRKGN